MYNELILFLFKNSDKLCYLIFSFRNSTFWKLIHQTIKILSNIILQFKLLMAFTSSTNFKLNIT